MKTYKIIFEDTFSFSLSERTTQFNENQYQQAVKAKENKQIVVNKYDKVNAIHYTLIIKSIEEVIN